MNRYFRAATAFVSAASLLQPVLVTGTYAETAPLVVIQPDAAPDVVPHLHNKSGDHRGDEREREELIRRLREKVKYVFVIFNENHSFDNEYGTLPGVNGIYSDGRGPRSAANTPGFTQTYTDVNGQTQTVQPFLIGSSQNATFTDSVDHSHTGLAKKLDVVNGVPQMDKFAQDEYTKYAQTGATAAQQAKGKQFANLVMSHIDCDTIPFFWRYASRFTIFDNIFATEDTPSTPNAVAMIAGQAGETQWVKHPEEAAGVNGPISGTINGTTYSGSGTTQGVPLVNDPQPYWGSEYDATSVIRQPDGAPGQGATSQYPDSEFYGPTNIAPSLTFASVPLTLMGKSIKEITRRDVDPSHDLADIQKDIPYISSLNAAQIDWRWYQNGYGVETYSADASGIASHAGYVSHHQGPQYFGYLANNPALRKNFRSESDFFKDIEKHNLPESGVFYIRGGFYNLDYPKVTPVIQNKNYPNPAGLTATEIATINATKSGDDDHPGYSDRQISESAAARIVNAIAKHPDIWRQSAIIITYDESDGFYDHVRPRILSYGPDGLPLARGIRVPLILISPYARAHATSHAEGDHNAIIETINDIFKRPALSELPDEKQALADGDSAAFNKFGPSGFEQKHLGPRDTNSPITDSLLSGFDPARLSGEVPPLPGSYAMIPDNVVNSYPHYNGQGCKAIGIVPEDKRQGIQNQVPAGFNTLPSILPAYN